MAITGQQVIDIGLPNESTGSDSLRDAFTKCKDNFANLFACASPYTTFTGNSSLGLSVSANANTVTIENTGVYYASAGNGIVVSGNTGNVTFSANVSSNTLNVTSTTNNINLELANSISVPYITTGNLTSSNTLVVSGSENISNGSAVSLAVTTSYFTTTTASTATLAAGGAGLIKTFMMVADGGDMVITVANAGWKAAGTGTITFNDMGDGCTLQYMNNKWYCIGQNGVTFA